MDISKKLIPQIPKEVSYATDTLEEAGFEAYLVGGCVRDLLMGKEPKDWDIATNAKPEKIIKLFEKTVYENDFGTVKVIQEDVSQGTLYQIEVTPYRIESKYSDFRHPDGVKFSDKIEDDLKRRDFTINAVAFRNGCLTDMFGGLKDIKAKVIRAVGEPDSRFKEDALRMLRAVRIALQLNFSVSYETSESILKNTDLIKKISPERICDEFVKIIMSENSANGIVMLQKFGLLKNIIPELEEGIGCEQLGEHIYNVWDHLLHALQHAADKNWPLEVRLSALFHDIGKPKTRRYASSGALAQDFLLRNVSHSQKHTDSASATPKAFSSADDVYRQAEKKSLSVSQVSPDASAQDILLKQRHHSHKHTGSTFITSKKKYTFYGHEVVGARMAKKIMGRLKFSQKAIELVEKLVRNHMFFSDTELITLSAVRRIIKKVGVENIWLLMNVRECDRVGMRKKEAPYRLRKYFAMIEEALRDPISVGALKINGEFMIKNLKIKPGPRMGWILHALLEEVLDDPTKNTIEHLSELVKSLNLLPDGALKVLGDRGKEKKEELEEEEISKLHEKHGVRK